MLRVFGDIDSGVDIKTLAIVALSPGEEFQLRVFVHGIDPGLEFLERRAMDHGTDEVIKSLVWSANLEGFGFGLNACEELFRQGLRDICSGSSRTFLTLVLECAANGLNDGVTEIRGRVNDVEVLPASLADDSRVPSKPSLDDTLRDFAVQLTEDSGRASVVKACEFLVCQNDFGNFLRVAWDELDDVGWETGFEEDFMEQVIAVDGRRRGFPDDHISHESWGSCKVAADGSKVKGRDRIDETLKGTVLDTASK